MRSQVALTSVLSLTLLGACVSTPIATSSPSSPTAAVGDTPLATSAGNPRPSGTAVVPDRPLALPSFGRSCSRSSGHRVLPDVGLGIGTGPVWPVGFDAGPAFQTLSASTFGSWYPIKILWAAAPSYMGPVRVRGQRIDRPGAMQFSLDGGATLTPELILPADPTETTARTWPSYTLVETTGCYAYQIDGTDFSQAVVFEVTT